MNLDWIMSPLTMYGTLAAGCAGCLYLVLSARLEMAQYAKRYSNEKDRLERSVAGLTARIQELADETSQRPAVTVAVAPPPVAVGLNKRTEALRMYRRGSDSHTIAATVGLTPAEAALLGKVHHILNDSEHMEACAS